MDFLTEWFHYFPLRPTVRLFFLFRKEAVTDRNIWSQSKHVSISEIICYCCKLWIDGKRRTLNLLERHFVRFEQPKASWISLEVKRISHFKETCLLMMDKIIFGRIVLKTIFWVIRWTWMRRYIWRSSSPKLNVWCLSK